MNKRIKYIEFLYIASPLLLLIIATISTVFQFITIATSHQEVLIPFMDMAINIVEVNKRQPISNIAVVNENQPCPREYITMQLGEWAGTKAGCLSLQNGTLLDKSCINSGVKTNEMNDWKDIPRNDKTILYNWANYKFCAKYLRQYSNPTFSSTGVECQNGWKKCSKDLLCVPPQYECPITSLNVKFFGTWQLPAVTVERDPNQNAIVSLSTSINKNPCMNPKKYPALHNTTNHPLNIAKMTGCDQYDSDSEFYQKLDQETLLEFYFQNKMGTTMKNLPGEYIEYFKDDSIALYSRTRVNTETSMICGQTSDYLNIIANNIQHFSFGEELSIVLVAYNIIFIVFGFVMFFYLYCDRENEQRDRYYREQKCLFHSFHFLPYIICILYITQYVNIPVDGGIKASSLVKISQILTTNHCFQGTPYHDIFASLSGEVLKITKEFFDPIRVMGIVSYSFIGLMLLLRGVRGFYNNEVQAYEKEYLEKRFASTRNAETELVRAEGASPMDIVVYEEEYEDDPYSSSPYFPYRDQDEQQN